MDPDGNHANDVASSGHHSNRTSPASSIGNSTTITTVAAAAAAADHLHGTARYGNLPNPDGIHSNEINPSSSLGHHSNHTPPVSSVGYSTTIPMNTTITVLRVSPLPGNDKCGYVILDPQLRELQYKEPLTAYFLHQGHGGVDSFEFTDLLEVYSHFNITNTNVALMGDLDQRIIHEGLRLIQENQSTASPDLSWMTQTYRPAPHNLNNISSRTKPSSSMSVTASENTLRHATTPSRVNSSRPDPEVEVSTHHSSFVMGGQGLGGQGMGSRIGGSRNGVKEWGVKV